MTKPKEKSPAIWLTPSLNSSMGTFGRLAFLAAAVVGLHAETLDDILARMDQSARSFRTFSAKIKRTEFTKVLPNDKDETDGIRRLAASLRTVVSLTCKCFASCLAVRNSSRCSSDSGTGS